MLKTFITSFKLQNTYRTNSIIYSIKQLPIIKRILPNSLYKNRGLKIFASIISILMEIINIFIGKNFIYLINDFYGINLVSYKSSRYIYTSICIFNTCWRSAKYIYVKSYKG